MAMVPWWTEPPLQLYSASEVTRPSVVLLPNQNDNRLQQGSQKDWEKQRMPNLLSEITWNTSIPPSPASINPKCTLTVIKPQDPELFKAVPFRQRTLSPCSSAEEKWLLLHIKRSLNVFAFYSTPKFLFIAAGFLWEKPIRKVSLFLSLASCTSWTRSVYSLRLAQSYQNSREHKCGMKTQFFNLLSIKQRTGFLPSGCQNPPIEDANINMYMFQSNQYNSIQPYCISKLQ